MNNVKNLYKKLVLSMLFVLMCMTACDDEKSSKRTEAEQPKESVAPDDNSQAITMDYDMTMKAIIRYVDTQLQQIRIQNASGGLEYILNYTNGTVVRDKFGKNKMIEDVMPGDVVETYIDAGNEKLAAIIYSSENWVFEGSENWKFNSEKQELNIGKEKYYFSEELVILSGEEEMTIMDLNPYDILNIQGCGKKVLSVTLEKGHGYVNLQGTDDFIGGWVEIGKVIKPISKDMLIVVPEGNWDVTVVKDGYGGTIGTSVERNQEAVVDFTGVAAEIVRYGTVQFTLEPADALVYIAGREVDTDKQILLEYDTYKIRVSADGYEDYTGNLKVSKALTHIKVDLTKEGESEEPSDSPTPSESPTPTQTPEPSAYPVATPAESVLSVQESEASDSSTIKTSESPSGESMKVIYNYKIKVESPKGVNVYFDDAFVGVSPVSFTKISGDHTLTFSKDGYVTKSYTVEIGTDETDATFELPDLEPEK